MEDACMCTQTFSPSFSYHPSLPLSLFIQEKKCPSQLKTSASLFDTHHSLPPPLLPSLAPFPPLNNSVQFVRGFGRFVEGLITPNELNIVAGSIMRVHVGGAFTGVGCMFRERNNTRESFMHEVESAIRNPLIRSRQFGQLILVLGGTLHLNGCK